MGELMAGVKAADTEIDLVSLNTSPLPNHLEYRTYEALIVADMVRPARMADAEAYDAMVIGCFYDPGLEDRSEEHTSELQSLMRISYAVFCLKKKITKKKK